MSLVLINGLGRSGTSWVHKVFDQHPDVFASFEPENTFSREYKRSLRRNVDNVDIDEYSNRLFSTKALRAMRKRPIVRKSFRADWLHHLRVAYMYGFSGLDKVLPIGNLNGFPVPDFTDRSKLDVVVKSVAQQRQLPRIIENRPDIKVIYLIRHPCARAESLIKGVESGKMHKNYLPPRQELSRLFEFDRPVSDLKEDEFDQTEINAYCWAVFNDVMLGVIEKSDNARAFVYEELCADPLAGFQEMFEWSGIAWHEDCAAFLNESLQANSDSSAYHGLVRNPSIAANKWRETIDPQLKAKVLNICKVSSAASLYGGFEADF